MSIPIGAVVDAHNPVFFETSAMRASYGSSGASSGANIFQSASDQALQADELAGRIGPAVAEYDAEAENRLIQEY
jgi:hypothetical protein